MTPPMSPAAWQPSHLPAVTFKWFTNGTCTGGSAVANDGMEGSLYKSVVSAALAGGSYAYQATVASDTNYTGATSSCEPLTVTPKQLAISTAIHDASHAVVTSVELGAIVHDTANVTGGVDGFALPAVTFKWFTNGTCTGGSAVANDGMEGSLYKSVVSAALAGGSYAYQATVASDNNYTGATSLCEPLTVTPKQLAISTAIHDASHAVVTSVGLGAIVHDTANVTGGVERFASPSSDLQVVHQRYLHWWLSRGQRWHGRQPVQVSC